MEKIIFDNPELKKEYEILFIVPKYSNTVKKDYSYLFPFGLGYISSVLKKAGYKVTNLNLNHHEGSINEIMSKFLEKKKYDFVCTGHTGMGFVSTRKIINAVRENSDSKFILGGPIITSEPKLMFNELKPDYAVYGEGEITVLKLLEAIEKKQSLDDVKGLIYWKNNEMVLNEKREPIENIDELPFPDFGGLEFEEWTEHQNASRSDYKIDYPRVYPILCSRSCPFNCTFCYHSIGQKYRERSMDNIVKELKDAVKKYKINMVLLIDDLFAYKKERLYSFCDEIKKISESLPEKLIWTCSLTVNTVDDEMLRTMKNAGCVAIGYGFESYNKDVLKSMRKPITPEKIDYALKATLKAGINVKGNFIFGDVAETNETARETLEYWKNNCKGQLSLMFIQPYPGSAIYHHCVNKGIIKNKIDFIENEMGNILLNMTDKMSDEDINKLFKETLYLRNKYGKFAVPKSVKKQENGNYSVEVECPYCKDIITYNNCPLENKHIYKTYYVCRHCNMRYTLLSSIVNFLRNNYYFSAKANEYYRKIIKNVNKLKV